MGGRLIPEDLTDDFYRPTFEAWPKTPRLYRDVVVTEKIDGTNCAILIYRDECSNLRAAAQSRNRLITPGKSTDNYGFAQFVADNEDALIDFLGEGRHFGEWWGVSIARKYALTERRFSLFNTHRWDSVRLDYDDTKNYRLHETLPLYVVPTLYTGPNNTALIDHTLELLRQTGSWASPGFMDPEGIMVYHTAARQIFKVTTENDEIPKALVGKGGA